MGKGMLASFIDLMKLDDSERFDSIYDIMDFFEKANIQEADINAELEKCDARTRLSSREKNRIRRDCKARLKDLQREIDDTLDLLTNYTTFDSKVIMPVIAKFLSITEDEEFGLMSDVSKDDDVEVFTAKPVKFKGTTYYIITTLSNIDFLEEIRLNPLYNSLKSIEEYVGALDNDKYICIKKPKKINILDGISLEECFVNFPELKRLGYAIVNLGLRHPEFTDDEIFDAILKTVRRGPRVTR